VPLQNPDFAPFLQRARDAAPEALFAFVPSGVGSVLMRQFVEGFRRLTNGARPNFMGVGGYDGMTLICRSVEAAGAAADGAQLVEAMKGLSWESPRGPVAIDARTREMTQNIYIRRVERVGGELFNVEFDTFRAVGDPAKARAG